jgi:uncharacterized protein YjiS (DUF1127 family)
MAMIGLMSPSAAGGRRRGRIAWSAAMVSLVDQIMLWQERGRSRRCLAALDDRMLRDIGIDRATAEREASRTFWRGR